ncbi:Receptor-type tyrosine-protein phosphatase N2 [Acipenser ruthenus]|uniref:Receptor-type tyrosine-protein phosphatase N2 n=1 Tax=Acipenser ruthenus TaxID=7906 RepID=A0A662YL68_ACIRT|nr:Receptor-type tyrosine-protein phosphatase N2 [Acipenser ruthenus]
MVWENGCVVIVMLTPLTENGVKQCYHYWPDEGSNLYNIYEVNLVSEHIWCEDFLVRSFYLKNLQTNETRTVTQFHFLSWMNQSVPESTRSLLDFRRYTPWPARHGSVKTSMRLVWACQNQHCAWHGPVKTSTMPGTGLSKPAPCLARVCQNQHCTWHGPVKTSTAPGTGLSKPAPCLARACQNQHCAWLEITV